jgi:hypothetical protein
VFVLSLVSLTIILVVTAPRGPVPPSLIASSLRYTNSGTGLQLIGGTPQSPPSEFASIRASETARHAHAVWLRLIRRVAGHLETLRPAPALPSQSVVASPAPPVLVRTSGVNWYAIAQCESGGRWWIVDPPFYGGLQFLLSTWRAAGGLAYASSPNLATAAQQIAVAEHLLQLVGGRGWTQWPVCWWRQ